MVQELRQVTEQAWWIAKKRLPNATETWKRQRTIWQEGLATAFQESWPHRCRRHGARLHSRGGRIGVLLEVNIETDFAARTEDFKDLVHQIALHIAAFSPQYVRREEVPAE
jgi:elongation factor Ts